MSLPVSGHLDLRSVFPGTYLCWGCLGSTVPSSGLTVDV